MKKTGWLLATALTVLSPMNGRLSAQGHGHDAFGGIWKLNTAMSDGAPTGDGPEGRGGRSGGTPDVGGFPGRAPGGGLGGRAGGGGNDGKRTMTQVYERPD